jgi:type III pantothenate kinase
MDLLAISVGNSRTRYGLFRGRSLERTGVLENADAGAAAAAIAGARTGDAALALASVNERFAEPLAAALEPRFPGRVLRFGRDLSIPIERALADDTTVGQDRLLNALGAYERARQACIVIDAGTAVTVDFVDGAGVFQGGAIAPGLNMMLRALHEHTAALPLIRHAPPAPGSPPYGKDTAAAMTLGVRSAVQGMARLLVDRIAESYGAYPRVIATGGDAPTLFEGDGVVEHIVPDLTLMGIRAACERLIGPDE